MAADTPFSIRTIASRRHKSAGWSAAYAPAAQVVAQPVSAWLPNLAIRRRETRRHLAPLPIVPVEQAAAPPATPGYYLDAPKARHTEYRRKLKLLPPLDVYPPPTGPPQTYYPAWATEKRRRAVLQRRRLLELEHNVYPATPAATPSADRALTAAFVTHKTRGRRLQVAHDAPVYPATPVQSAQPISAVVPVKAKKRKSRQGLFLSDGGLVEARIQPQYPSYELAEGYHRRRETSRTRRGVEHCPSYPATQAQVVAQIATIAAKAIRRRETARTLRRAPAHESYPVFAPVTAWLEAKAKRSKHERSLVTVPEQDSYPVFAPVSAWTAERAHRTEFERTLQKAAPQLEYPQTPAIGAQPEDAFKAQKQHRIARARRLIPAAEQITYPATPPVVIPVVAAWQLPPSFRVDRARTLLRLTPIESTIKAQPISATPRVDAIKRRETDRARRVAEHNAAYPATPAPPQAPTAFKLAEAFRRHGWRKARGVLELDVHPETPEQTQIAATARFVAGAESGRFTTAREIRRYESRRQPKRFEAE